MVDGKIIFVELDRLAYAQSRKVRDNKDDFLLLVRLIIFDQRKLERAVQCDQKKIAKCL